MFLKLIDKIHEQDGTKFIFDSHDGPVVVKYNEPDYTLIDQDPQMCVDLHAFQRAACVLQSRCTITQTVGSA